MLTVEDEAKMATHRDKGSGSLTKRKDGMWIASIELPPGLDGRRRRKQIARKDRGEAQRELRKMVAELQKTGNLSTRSIKLGDWLDTYMADIAPAQLSPKALYDRQSVVKLFVKPLLGKKNLDRISADDVRHLHKVILNTPKSPALRDLPEAEIPDGTVMLSSSYARNAHNALSAALKAAKREGKVSTNVCDLVDRPATGKAVDNALNKSQFIQLVRFLSTHPDRALWCTFLFTGARRGEVAGLEVQRAQNVLDLSWQLKQITNISSAHSSYEYRHVIGKRYLVRPKTSTSWRVLPMPALLLDILHEHIGDRTDGFVFLNRRGEPFDPSTLGRRWKDLLVDADLPSHVTLHGARHTFIDMLYNSNQAVREDTVMQIVGHSSRAMTRSYRQNVESDHAVSAFRSIESILEAT